MAIKVFDFVCPEGHRHERFVSDDMTKSLCPECGAVATKTMPAPRFTLEGVTGSFPGAAMQWEKKRAEKMAVQAQKERDHGDSGWT